MFIRTKNSLYDANKARSFEVAGAGKYGEYEAYLAIVWGYLESEGCDDSAYIFSGTFGECQSMLTRITSAIVQREIEVFTIKDNGTKQEKAKPESLFETEEGEIEVPF